MKLVRLGALFGSIVLLVATSITMFNKRSELRSDQDARALAAAFVVNQSVGSTVQRAQAVVDLAASNPAADAVSPASIVESFDSASACVITDATERCTNSSLLATDVFDRALDALSSPDISSVVVADPSTNTLLIVAVDALTVALQLPTAELVTPAARESIEQLDATSNVTVSVSGDDGLVGPETIDGSRVVTASIALEGGGGALVVSAGVVDDVGIFGQNLVLYGALLGLGTVLIALAGWTFLAERKNLERRATTDELTGLVNRREFERLTEDALLEASRFGTGVCLMLIDLNGFKQVNDTLGHQFGDLVLQASAERLKDAVRDTDVVGRWGGDEFVIMLPGVEDGTAVRTSAERIASRLSTTPVVGDVSMSGSIGAALYPRHGGGLDDLIRAADVAMYEAKTTGVTHRLADSLTVDLAREATVEDYQGPERRRHPSASNIDRYV